LETNSIAQLTEEFTFNTFSQNKTTGEIVEVIVENVNVTVIPGETVIIHNDGTDKRIAVKNNGEYLGTVR
jgi:hypothetical protein